MICEESHIKINKMVILFHNINVFLINYSLEEQKRLPSKYFFSFKKILQTPNFWPAVCVYTLFTVKPYLQSNSRMKLLPWLKCYYFASPTALIHFIKALPAEGQSRLKDKCNSSLILTLQIPYAHSGVLRTHGILGSWEGSCIQRVHEGVILRAGERESAAVWNNHK